MNIVLAGGGTAGHTSPLIATAESLKARHPDVVLTCVGTPKGLESRVIPAAGLELVMIPPVPLPRRLSGDLVKVPLRLRDATRKARAILRQARADVVVGFGGYVSLPVYLAAWRMGVPIVIHEQNALPGLANRIAARLTKHVAVSFPGTPLPHSTFVGLPVRTGIARLDRAAHAQQARAEFGLPRVHPVLLVSGGSQGARSINTAVIEAAPTLLAAGINVLHVLGPRNMTDDTVVRTDAITGAQYRPVAFVDRMEDAYAAADLMIARSGAGTVAETAMVGLPAIFVPLPIGNGEQARNADALIAADAGRLIPDAECTAVRIVDEVLDLLGKPQLLAAMSGRLRDLMPTHAADALADLIIRVASEGT